MIFGHGSSVGEKMLNDKRVPLISITGSTKVGRHGAEVIARRFGKSILELGGNNAIILTPNANLSMVLPAIVFGAVGTAGQRCTSTRRLIIHESIYDNVKEVIVNAYAGLKIGNPLDENNHVGPLIDSAAVKDFLNALKKVQEETFAPILYLIKYSGEVQDALQLQTMWSRASPRPSSQKTYVKLNYSFRQPALTAALPTSISAPQALRSAVLLAVKKKPAVIENPVPTPGKHICAGRPTPSTTARPSH